MNKRVVKTNIKKTLFFSYSVIFSTLFFLTYLGLKNECWDIEKEIGTLEQNKYKYSNNIKSLKRKKSLLIRSAEQVALNKYNLIIPDPQPIVIMVGNKE